MKRFDITLPKTGKVVPVYVKDLANFMQIRVSAGESNGTNSHILESTIDLAEDRQYRTIVWFGYCSGIAGSTLEEFLTRYFKLIYKESESDVNFIFICSEVNCPKIKKSKITERFKLTDSDQTRVTEFKFSRILPHLE